MRLFDTHAHLLDARFDEDREALLTALPAQGVVGFVEIGTDIAESTKAAELAARVDYIYAAAGVHPHEAKDTTDDFVGRLRALATRPKVVAIGEIGLDYHYDFSPRDVQRRVFEQQLALAAEVGLPVVLHMREATQDMMGILRDHRGVRGVMHCFSGSAETAAECIELGLYVSFAGTITFSSARKTIEAAEAVPMDRILAETDSPYLTPEPRRGRRNDPSHVRYVIEKLAAVKGMSFEDMCEINIANAKGLYAI